MKVHTSIVDAGARNVGHVLTWNRRADSWDHSAMPGMTRIAETVLGHAGAVGGLDVVDLGAGSGQLALELAKEAKSVVAVDFSPAMLARLREKAAGQGTANVQTVLSSLETFDLPPGSLDLVVSNYALHHLRDPQKAALLVRAARWLRPGGRIVIGDMMFSVTGGGRDDRQIIATKIRNIARRGPAGWWRIAKNAWRFLVARDECPASLENWVSMLGAAGFSGIRPERVVAEGAVVSGLLAEP